jgi:hypothetical protein
MERRSGLDDVTSSTRVEEFDYRSGSDFLNSPLITDFLLLNWLRSIPEGVQTNVTNELARIIDEERHAGEFSLTVKVTLVAGRKARIQ